MCLLAFAFTIVFVWTGPLSVMCYKITEEIPIFFLNLS